MPLFIHSCGLVVIACPQHRLINCSFSYFHQPPCIDILPLTTNHQPSLQPHSLIVQRSRSKNARPTFLLPIPHTSLTPPFCPLLDLNLDLDCHWYNVGPGYGSGSQAKSGSGSGNTRIHIYIIHHYACSYE